MDEVKAAMGFGQAIYELSSIFFGILTWASDLFGAIPFLGRVILGVFFVVILIEIVLAYVSCFIKYPTIKEFKENRRKVYLLGPGYKHVATLLGVTTRMFEDRRGFGVSGLAHSLGNFEDDSRFELFILSLIYVPFSIVGFVEFVLRVVIGYIILFILTMLHGSIVIAGTLVGLLLIAVLRIAEMATQK